MPASQSYCEPAAKVEQYDGLDATSFRRLVWADEQTERELVHEELS